MRRGFEAALRCRAGYDQALARRGGDAFGGFSTEWWALAESTRLAELEVVADEERAAALVAIGRDARAVPVLESVTLEHPISQARDATTLLMLFARSWTTHSGRRGRQHAA